MLGETCSHGVPWSEDCPQCALISAREAVRHWGPLVDEARKLINQCDGCQIGAPYSPMGDHHMPDGGFMGCTKDRYVEPGTEES